ncbi:MAG: preprotein translocase subunit YajC [Flavobacteriales bacterium]|nr:preprotein translocase subunit YajC [Flavobacteriales bacterium]
MIFIGLMFVVMYFFFIRPQQKKAKEAQKFREALTKGARVVTIGGIHGKILDIDDKTVLLQCDSGKLRVEKSAVSATSSVEEQEIAAKA